MEISHKQLLAHLAQSPVRNYADCRDLSLNGEKYKVREMRCFVDHADNICDYVLLRMYSDAYIVADFHTQSASLIDEAACAILALRGDFAEAELRTLQPISHEIFTKAESIPSPNPTFFMESEAEIRHISNNTRLKVSVATDDVYSALVLNPSEINAQIFEFDSICPETRLYLLSHDEEIVGYLRAEKGFANILDVGFLFILPSFRGNSFGKYLATAFAKDCFLRGEIPHYGSAVSPASEAVARAVGFQREPLPICKLLSLGCKQ